MIDTLDQLLVWELVQGIIIAYIAYKLTMKEVNNFYKRLFKIETPDVDPVKLAEEE